MCVKCSRIRSFPVCCQFKPHAVYSYIDVLRLRTFVSYVSLRLNNQWLLCQVENQSVELVKQYKQKQTQMHKNKIVLIFLKTSISNIESADRIGLLLDCGGIKAGNKRW